MNPDRLQRRLDDKRESAYLADTMDGAFLRDAVERILIKIATGAGKLPDDFKATHPDIDWAGMNRMRNLVAHHYDKVNDNLLWQALTTRIPDLVTRLTRQVRRLPHAADHAHSTRDVGRPQKRTCRPIAHQ